MRHIFIRTLMCMALCYSCAAIGDDPFSFKDLRLGSSLDERRGDPRFPTCGERSGVAAECYAFSTDETIAGAHIQVIALNYYDRRLYKITLMVHSNLVSDISDALEQKYGKPSRDVLEPTKNRMGAEFMNQIRTWTNDVSSITTTHYAGSIKSGVIEFTLNGEEELARAHRRDSAKKSAKDL